MFMETYTYYDIPHTYYYNIILLLLLLYVLSINLKFKRRRSIARNHFGGNPLEYIFYPIN